ncbi:uncharacterized protein LOC142348097 [Convolutriloba macropyga]|uniref:uncharacterized protein LOC142348097 n=1 Tax=Convolutriloba macropyga TaxID=536237 RepID=UPI003F52500E
MSQFSRSGRQINNPRQLNENEDLQSAMRKTLSSTYLLLFYFDDCKPSTLKILSEQILIPLEDRGSLKVEQIIRTRKDGKNFTAKIKAIGPKEVVNEHLAELSAVCHGLDIGDEPDIDFPIEVQDRSRQCTSAHNKENTDNGNAAVYTQLLPPEPDFSEEVALNQQQAARAEVVVGKPVATEPASNEKVMYNGEDLLRINASTTAKYGRKTAFKMLTTQELVEHMISPKKNPGSHCRPAIDDARKHIWEEAVKTKYKNNPLAAFEEAKDSVNRVGNEVLCARKHKESRKRQLESNSPIADEENVTTVLPYQNM